MDTQYKFVMKYKYILLSCLFFPVCAAGAITDVAGGNHHTFWIEKGTVFSTGQDLHKPLSRNTYIGGKLGRPVDDAVLPGKDPNNPVARANYNPGVAPVQGLEGQRVVKVASGQNDGAAITAAGRLYMWGPNDHGQLGLADRQQRRKATRVPLPADLRVRDVAIGNAHTLVLSEDGTVYGMGLNRNGVLGLGLREHVLTPTRIPGLDHEKIIAVAAAQNTHSLFLAASGKLYGCGRNTAHALGDVSHPGMILTRVVQIPAPVAFVAIGVGVHTSFALTAEGHLYGWGKGAKGHFARTLPDGSPDLSSLPQPTRLTNAPPHLVEVAAGSRHTVVRNAAGEVFTWGIHTVSSGQLGIGPPTIPGPGRIAGQIISDPQPVPLPGNARAVGVDSMANNVFVLTAQDALYGWGSTAQGRLGAPVDAFHKIVLPSGSTKFLAYEPVRIGVSPTDSPQ